MRIGYCKVYRSCFRIFGAKVLEIFVLMIRQFHRNESSWNVRFFRSTGAKVLSMVFSLPGTKVQRNEKAWNPFDNHSKTGNFSAESKSNLSFDQYVRG